MYGILKLAGLILGSTAVNLPLGYMRRACERFSLRWFFYVHLSIPMIIFLRIKASFGWQVVPLTIAGAMVGQLLGGACRELHINHD